MYGGVSPRTVRQFRMPGYPYVLVTTDVLQEGEDLHTFCDRIVHYGISWTPSAIEQRIGRVDRIGSLVQRRLEGEHRTPAEIQDDDYLQVYFPYLRDTYEYVQMGVVFERLNRFLEMLHDLRLPRTGQASELDVSRQIHERADSVFQPYREPLKSGFPIPEELMPEGPAEPVVQPENSRLLKHFDELATGLAARFRIEWSSANHAEHQRQGMAFVQDGRLLAADEDRDRAGVRQQPFSLGSENDAWRQTAAALHKSAGHRLPRAIRRGHAAATGQAPPQDLREHGRRGRLVLSRGANRSALLPRDHTAGGIGARFWQDTRRRGRNGTRTFRMARTTPQPSWA